MYRLNMAKPAKFKCLKCGYKWRDVTGPTQCSICGHLYVKWINYEQLAKVWRKKYNNKYWQTKENKNGNIHDM